MLITCCRDCENRHIKCHANCETYHIQKILKILVEADVNKKRRTSDSIKNQKDRMVAKANHRKHLGRRK